MGDKNVIPLPGRAPQTSADLREAADRALEAVQGRIPLALETGSAKDLLAILAVYERDIIPAKPWFHDHFAYNLCFFGERLRSAVLLKQGVAHYDRILSGEFPGAPDTDNKKALMRGEAGFARLWLSDLDALGGHAQQAILLFEAALQSWRACLQFECVRLSVGLALARLAAVEFSGAPLLDAAAKAVSQAVEFDDSSEGPHWGDRRFAEAKAALLFARAGRPADIAAARAAAIDSINAYKSWEPRYVITPARIARAEAVRDALAAVL